MHKNRNAIVLLVLIFSLVACDNNPQPVITATPTATTIPTPLATATSVAVTNTPSPQPPEPTPSATSIDTSSTPTTMSTPSAIAGTESSVPGCSPDRLVNSPRDGLGDTLYPTLGNSGYDVAHYDVRLNVDVAGNTLSGDARLTAKALTSLSTFNLDFRGLNITKLLVDGKDASYTRNNGELLITPGTPLMANSDFSVEVTYDGTPADAARNGSPTEGWTNYKDGIYVAGEPDGSSTFYPVNEHPCDKATYSMTVTVPKPYVVASNGHLKSSTDNGSSTTYAWETTNPVASYLVALNIAAFDVETTQSVSGVPIRNYFPSDLPRKTRDFFKDLPQMVDFLSETFGPYPFEEYGVVVADTSLNFALETQTLSLFGKDVGAGDNPSNEVVLHELAHQWFGDSVSLEQWHDIWLNEGFATYAQWLWLEHKNGKAALDARVKDIYGVVKEQKSLPPGSPTADRLFDSGVYLRGALTLHALRLKIGDDAFFKTMKTYAERYRHGNAGTANFIAVAEEISGQQLFTLFDAWLYAVEMPPIPQLDLASSGTTAGAESPTPGRAAYVLPNLPDGWTKIEPAGDTACARGTPFSFWVHPGRANKLLLFFEGGGGCWSYDTCKPGSRFFTSTLAGSDGPENRGGMLDLANTNNPFHDYYAVYVPYCTGDVHMGSYTQTYRSTKGEEVTIQHKGFVNSSSAVNWAYQHFAAPESVFVAGCSAGSVGSILFAPYVIRHYDKANVTQFGDSEAYVFDHPVDLQTDWHAHDNFPNWIPAVSQISAGNFTMSAFYKAIANYYPAKSFSQYNTEHDTTQQLFYFAAALQTKTPPPWEDALDASLFDIHNAAPNFHTFMGPGSEHCVTPRDKFYSETSSGVSLRVWVADLANGKSVRDVKP
ncbi:MAG: pectin acetylesterase-family hydrolase [Chloroflexota bacterium]